MEDCIYEILAEHEYEAMLNRVCIFKNLEDATNFLDNLDEDCHYAESVDETETLILEQSFFGADAGSKKLREVTREYDENEKLIKIRDIKI